MTLKEEWVVMDLVEYKYFLKGEIKVPKTWEQYIVAMLKEFDKELRIKHIPKALSNFINRFKTKNKIKEIKTSFGELKVIGNFSPKFKQIIKDTKNKCRNTCEFCGEMEAEKVTIKSWVYNCCKKCKK
jgi:hypothetical protein